MNVASSSDFRIGSCVSPIISRARSYSSIFGCILLCCLFLLPSFIFFGTSVLFIFSFIRDVRAWNSSTESSSSGRVSWLSISRTSSASERIRRVFSLKRVSYVFILPTPHKGVFIGNRLDFSCHRCIELPGRQTSE